MAAFVTTAGSLSLVKALVDFAKYVRAKDHNGYLTQLFVWVAGILVMLLLRVSDFAAGVDVGGVSLQHAAWGTIILGGLGLGSTAMLTNDFKQALDRTDSAVKPPLISGPPAQVVTTSQGVTAEGAAVPQP